MSERMRDEEWMPQAERLLVGSISSARGDHDCGDPGSLQLSRSGNELRAYCHRCGAYGSKREQESQAERIARVRAMSSVDDEARQSTQLPEPKVYTLRQWPVPAALWFYKMGLSPSMIEELGLYWCPSLGRVVLPIMEGDHAVYWTARSHERTPKWIGPNLPKAGLVAKFGVGKGDTIVLTEDPLSAYKVGKCTEAWSLLGTKLHPRHITALTSEGKRVATWLDDDQGRRNGSNPGQEAAAKIRARLAVYGLDVRNIKSDRDPKYYNPDYIRRKL